MAIFSGAVYGLSWGVTDSTLFDPVRGFIGRRGPRLLSELIECIVCTSAWVGLVFASLVVPWTGLISVPTAPADVLVLVSWGVFSTWAIAVASSR